MPNRRIYGYEGHKQLKKRDPNKPRRKILKPILVGLIFCFIFGTIYTAWISRTLPDPDKLTEREIAQSTKIYDRTGEHLLYEVFTNQKRTLVNLEQIPKNLINGVVATEDSKFYEHKGVRPMSFVRAIVYKLLGKSSRLGATSTLTQQLVKNAILTNERSYSRKLKEIILALRLEQKYTKDQILKIYFNEIPYGSTNYGVESASQDYFGKSVSELNLAECATLAGLPRAPTTYLNNLTALKNRRDTVLERMFEEGYITREEADTAQAEPLKLERHFNNIVAPHFVLYVKEQLVNLLGEKLVDTGGLRVITTLDWDKQIVAEKAIKDAEKRLKEGNANNAALVAMNPKNGQILSMVGSVDFNNKEISGQFNVATQGKRQPGSSFKPIVYAAALEKGYTPDTILFDVKTNFAVSGARYEPQNYDFKERGPVTMRQALQGSLNIPAVQTLYLVGPKKGVEFAERLGYTTLSEGEFGLSLVLGGGEVKLLDHTNAYAVFANNGKYYQPVSVLKVETPDGEILNQWKETGGEKVLDEKITATMSNILSDDAARAYVFGAGGVLTLPGRPVAAKTGTTNNYRDAWTVGYTPSLVTGVWVGNTDNKEMTKGDGGSKLAAPIWKAFMIAALNKSPAENFPKAPANDAEKPILRGTVGGSVTLKINKETGRLAASSTPPELVIEKIYMPAHSILYYVNKDDPRGPTPTDPATDPQFNIWENAIQDWIKRTRAKNPNWQIDFSEPPTDVDDANFLAMMPSLEILSPAPNAILTSRQIVVSVKASAPRGITKVTYKIDQHNLNAVLTPPFSLNYYATWLEAGQHTLTAIAEDDIGNQIQKTADFTLDAAPEPPSVTWTFPEQTFSNNSFPVILVVNTFKADEIQELAVYYQSVGGNKTILNTISNPTQHVNNQLSFEWKISPGPGNYTLATEMKLKDGSVVVGGKMVVEVK